MAPTKQQIDSQIWKWTEDTSPNTILQEHVETSYRLQLPFCAPYSCRRNCKGNPKCFNGLGESNWQQEIEDEDCYKHDDPEDDRRPDGTFCGLKNLGATCYLNTFLQVWFHTKAVRDAVLSWKAEESKDDGMLGLPIDQLESLCTEEQLEQLFTPPSVHGQLQAIFVLLQHSQRRFIDPTPLITSLGLDTTLQQDAQEFWKLFTSLLENTMKKSSQHAGSNFIHEQFQGHYQYVTKCASCKGESVRPSQFYELDLHIKGHKDLHECIKNFLQEEKLEGDNQYMCPTCVVKCDAVRTIRLRCLPPILNLQLLRFVFDRQSGQKKKLSSGLLFPEILDMSSYLGEPDGSSVYELQAVLLHTGPSAYSGHYTAHIRAEGGWHVFNDEVIECSSNNGAKLKLKEEEYDSSKRPKLAPGTFTSRNAYMLVYQMKSKNKEQSMDVDLKNKEQSMDIDLKNKEQSMDIDLKNKEQSMDVDLKNKEQSMDIDLKNKEQSMDVGLKQAQTVTKDDQAVSKENHTVAMDDKTVATDEQTVATDDQTVATDNQTVATDDQTVATNNQTVNGSGFDMNKPSTSREMSARSKDPQPSGTSKLPLQQSGTSNLPIQLRRLVEWHNRKFEQWVKDIKEKREKDVNELKSRCEQVLRVWGGFMWEKGDDAQWLPTDWLREWLNAEDTGAVTQPDMSSLLCSHGKIDLDKVPQLKCISWSSAEEMLQQYESYPRMSRDKSLCQECVHARCRELHTKARIKMDSDFIVPASKIALTPTNDDNLYWIAKKSLRSWKKLALNSLNLSQDADVNGDEQQEQFNEELYCKSHGALNTDSSKRCLVTADVWNRLKYYFPEAPEFPKSTAECQQCAAAERAADEERALRRELAVQQRNQLTDLFLYRHRPAGVQGATNIVCRQFYDKWCKFIRDQCDAPETICNNCLLCPHRGFIYEPETVTSEHENICLVTAVEWTTLKEFYKSDEEISLIRVEEDTGHVSVLAIPEMCAECHLAMEKLKFEAKLCYKNVTLYVRKINVEDEAMEEGSSFTNGHSELLPCKRPALDPVRRSGRHKRMRGEKDITVSSTDTLKTLKIKIMSAFSVPPFDQHLIYNGQELEGNEQTLADLKILPGAAITLKADEATAEESYFEDVSTVMCQEEGFKGTSLMGHS